MKKQKIIIRRGAAFFTFPVIKSIRLLSGPGIRILMYHRVTEKGKDRLSVSPLEFERQMDFLNSGGYRVQKLSEAFSTSSEESSLPSVVLTFDDGYLDFYQVAFPILKKRKLPATVFVITDFIEGKITIPRNSNLPEETRSVSWDMLKEMQEERITVGAHSVTHRELTGLGSREAGEEIKGSSIIIKEKLGTRPKWFSYPRGKYSPKISRMVEENGFEGAVTVRPGPNRRPCDYFTLCRTEISRSDEIRDFKLKLVGAYDLQHYIIQKIMGERL